MKKPLDTPTRIISPGRNPATLALSTPGVLHTIDSCQPFSPGSSIQAAASRQHASPQLKLLRSTSGLTQWRWRAASLRSRPASRTSTCLLPPRVSACFNSVFGPLQVDPGQADAAPGVPITESARMSRRRSNETGNCILLVSICAKMYFGSQDSSCLQNDF